MKRILALMLLFTSALIAQTGGRLTGTFPLQMIRDSNGVYVTTPAGKPFVFVSPAVGTAGYWTRGTAPNSGTVRVSTTTDTVRVGTLISDGKIAVGGTSATALVELSANGGSLNQFIALNNTEVGHVRRWFLGVVTASGGKFRIFDATANTDRAVIDSLGNFGFGMNESATSMMAVKGRNDRLNIFEWYRSASATAVITADSLGTLLGVYPGSGGSWGLSATSAGGVLNIRSLSSAAQVTLDGRNTVLNRILVERFDGTDVSSIDTTGFGWFRGGIRTGLTNTTTYAKIDSAKISADTLKFYVGGTAYNAVKGSDFDWLARLLLFGAFVGFVFVCLTGKIKAGEGSMRYTLILAVFLAPSLFAQERFLFSFGNKSWESRWSTSVLNVGDSTCGHKWLNKPKSESFYGMVTSCLVLHDERGCPNNWGYKERICELCLRKEADNEERYFPQSELARVAAERDEVKRYEELDKRIGKK